MTTWREGEGNAEEGQGPGGKRVRGQETKRDRRGVDASLIVGQAYLAVAR